MVRAHSRASALSGDARKQPAQLDGGRQLAALLVDGADRSGLGYGEHRWSMGRRDVAGNCLAPAGGGSGVCGFFVQPDA
jgi:hypothetical protein